MTLAEFEASLAAAAPPAVHPNLQALWWQAKGDWDAAHEVVQERSDRDAEWIHAFLHRDEGDLGNAGYWYRRAGRPAANGDLRDEWRAIATELLR